MAEVKTLVVTGYGTNCENESAFAAKQAGADVASVVYFSDIKAGRVRMDEYNFLIFPGGFLDGDDLGAAQAAATRWKFAKTVDGEPVIDQLKALFQAGGLILGICNGFQLLVKLGLLPGLDGKYFERRVSLSSNDSARFEDRWVRLCTNPKSPCVFTKNIASLELPIRHGEGKLITQDKDTLEQIQAQNLIALQYADPKTGQPTQKYPHNPNGSPLGIAGLSDPTGRILGLMPHPEGYNHRTNHPGWTRGEQGTLGTALIANGVNYLKEQ